MEFAVSAGGVEWHPSKTWHKECRCFVRQQGASVIGSKILFASYLEYQDRHVYHNLQDVDVVFYPPWDHLDSFEVVHTPHPASVEDLLLQEPLKCELQTDASGTYVVIKNITGSLSFCW
jgi:hypothetical protein